MYNASQRTSEHECKNVKKTVLQAQCPWMGRSLTSSPRLEHKPFSSSRRGRQHLGASSSVRDTRPGLDQATPQRWCLVQMEQTLCGLHYSQDCRVPPRRHDGVHTMFSRVPSTGIQEWMLLLLKADNGNMDGLEELFKAMGTQSSLSYITLP